MDGVSEMAFGEEQKTIAGSARCKRIMYHGYGY